MSKIFSNPRLKFDVSLTATIMEAAQKAINVSELVGQTVEFDFNEVSVRVNANSDVRLIARGYVVATSDQKGGRQVGP